MFSLDLSLQGGHTHTLRQWWHQLQGHCSQLQNPSCLRSHPSVATMVAWQRSSPLPVLADCSISFQALKHCTLQVPGGRGQSLAVSLELA